MTKARLLGVCRYYPIGKGTPSLVPSDMHELGIIPDLRLFDPRGSTTSRGLELKVMLSASHEANSDAVHCRSGTQAPTSPMFNVGFGNSTPVQPANHASSWRGELAR